MKHLKLFFALFAMLALGVGNAWGAALGSGYEKVTNISNLTTGDRVVVYADDISKGVTGWDGYKDATVAESGWVEYLVEVASGGVTLKDEGQSKYISLTTKNTFTYADNGSVCKVNTTGVLAITLNGSDYFLYQNGTNYRMYTDKSSYSNYYPFYVYKVVAGGAETEDLGDALKWSAATATVQVGADDNEYPTLVNDKNVTVTYSSASTDVATINETTGVVTLVKEGTTTISAFYEGGEIDGVTYSAKNVSYTLTVKPAPLVIEPIEGGIIDILTHETFGVTSTSYTSFSGKQATNDNHSDAVYAGKTARNGNATQYNIQLNQLKDGRQFATTTSGGLAKRVYVKWATQGNANANARSLYIYGSNTAYTGSETSTSTTEIGTITFTTGAAEAYVDLTGDYKYILITGSGAIYMDEIQVTWVSAAGTVVTPTISGETEFVESTEVSISTEPGYKVYYTLNGEDPTNTSEEYTAPFTVNATTIVKAIAYDGTSASDVVSTTFKKLQSLTCAEAAELCTTTESADKYVIRGYVTSIPYPYSASNTAPTFWMADTKGGGNVMQAYKVTPVEETDKAVAVGDQVQVIGKIKLYNTTPEVNTGIYTITVKNPEYNVNITSAHGTVTATPAPAVEGAEVTLSVDVESGWVFQSWTVTDASSNPIEVVDNKFTMPASDVTVVANYTESEAPDAVLKLSANGTIISTATYKVGEKVELPATIENDCVKMFVGWSADANCATAPEYAPGADFTLTAEEHTLYAVYGTQTGGGEGVLTKMTSTDAFANGDKVVIVAYGTQLGMYQETSGTTYVKYWELVGNEPTVAELDDKTIWDVEADGENWKIGDATIGYLYNASSNNLAVSTTNASTWTITWNENGFVFKSDLGKYMACRTDLTTSNKNLYRMNGTTVSNNSTYEMDVYKYTSSAPTYSNYSTTCEAAPIATIDPTSVTATAAGAEGKVIVTYENVNTENVAVVLFNDEACTEAFTADWLTASLDGDKNIAYTVAENTTYAERKAYIQLTAPDAAAATDPDVVVIPVTQAGKDKVFASLAELVAADLTAGDEVTVTLNNDVIKEFYIYNSNRAGVVFDVQKDGKDIKIYFNNQTTIVDWAVGGKLSGTLTNVKWSTYSSAWQLVPDYNTWAWANLTYTEPKAVSTVVVSGAPTKTTYVDGEAFDPAGLTVTVNYNDATTEVNPTGVTFTVTPATLVKGQTSVSVTATFNSVASAAYEVTGLTVNEIPTKTVAEFIAAGGTRCYLEGIVSGLTEGNSMKYGNFDLTDASGTIYVYGCLNEAGEKEKFAELGVKNGDMIKVIADEYELYDGTKDEAIDVQYVSHISAATITIADITMEVEEVATITPTVDPVDAVVTYTIKENAANAISLSGNTITALKEGTATITATVAEGATYLGNSVDFTVTVGPKSEKVVILAEREGQWYALKAEYLSGETDRLVAVPVDYFNGSLYNVEEEIKATIEWNSIIVEGDKVSFLNDGKYLKGKSTTKLILEEGETDLYLWDKDTYTMTINGTVRTFLYNGEAFRNFAISNAGQTKDGITYSSFPVVTAPVYATGTPVYTRTVTPRNYGTICLPYGSTEYSGATFFEIAYRETGKVYIDEVTTLEAGVPYIFQANSSTLTVTCEGEAVGDAGSANGLYGTFIKIADVAAEHDDKDEYILTGGFIRMCELNCQVPANRAYIVLDEISTEQTPAPVNRRRVGMSVQGENETTGVEDLFTTESPAKVIENGQLIIIRDGVKYNVQGQKL